MKFRDLNLKIGGRLLWYSKKADSLDYNYWVGKVIRITEPYLFVTWFHFSDSWEQTVPYSLNQRVFRQLVFGESGFAEYLDLFSQTRVAI